MLKEIFFRETKADISHISHPTRNICKNEKKSPIKIEGEQKPECISCWVYMYSFSYSGST